MSAARVADTTDRIWVTVELGGVGFEPSDSVVNILELQRLREPFAYPLANGSHNHAGRG